MIEVTAPAPCAIIRTPTETQIVKLRPVKIESPSVCVLDWNQRAILWGRRH